jgi:hypothetical protein
MTLTDGFTVGAAGVVLLVWLPASVGVLFPGGTQASAPTTKPAAAPG